MHIRKSVETDFDAILAIYNQAIPTHQMTADLYFATRETRKAWFEFHLSSEKYPLWTVEDENGVIGWFSFSPYYERPAFVHTSEISLYLDEKAKGKGYGSKIIQYMQDKMLEHGIHTLMAYVFELNQVSMNLMKNTALSVGGVFQILRIWGKTAMVMKNGEHL